MELQYERQQFLAIMRWTQTANSAINRKQCLQGLLETQIESWEILAHILSREEVNTILCLGI